MSIRAEMKHDVELILYLARTVGLPSDVSARDFISGFTGLERQGHHDCPPAVPFGPHPTTQLTCVDAESRVTKPTYLRAT